MQTAVNLQQYEQISRSLLHPNLLTEFQNRSRELQDLLLNSDQAWKVVDEFISIITDETPRIIPNGGAIADGLVEAERRRWDYNPTNPTPPRGAGPTGNYYKNPYPIGNMSNGPPQPYNRVLASGDFEGMVKWIKDFIATGQNGGGRLSKMAKGEIAPYTLDTTTAIQIPATPVITYSGPVGYPLNQLQFTSTGFASPNGQTFTGQQWRIGEVYDPSVPGFAAGEPWKYEIENIWTSAELAVFSAAMPFPPDGLATGKTYRARVRHKDSLGRWSHWSAPVQFQAGAAVLGNAEQNLVISEIHYHPTDEPTLTLFDGDEYEFIEFMNIHPTAQISTDSLAMIDGVTLLLPNELLNPGERVVIVRNLTAFRQKYGPAPRVIGQYTDGLRNAGETLILGIGTTPIRTVPYLDSFPWPNSADGGDASLVLIAPQTNPDHSLPQNWRPSAVSGGTPGTADTTTFSGTATTNADQDGFDALAEYAMGTSDAAADSGLPQLQTEWIDGKPVLTWQRSLAADDILYIIETSSDLTTWIPAQSNLLDETRNGPNWTLQHEITPPDPSQRFYVRLRFQKRL